MQNNGKEIYKKIVLHWAELFRVSAKFEFRFESLKSISVLILLTTIWWLEALKITEQIIRENAFEHKKKKPGLNLTPG